MVTVHFTKQLERFMEAPSVTVKGETLGAVLDAVFQDGERLRGYILDDQGALRRHVALFIAGEPVKDRITLTDPVPDGAEIHIMQALSGG